MPAPKSGSKASSASKPASAPPPPKSGSAASSAYKPAESKYWSAPPSSASKSESAASSAQASHQLKLSKAITAGITEFMRGNPPPATWLAERREEIRYTIGRGDTISEIAVRYGVSPSALKKRNRLSSDRIRVGQTIYIPRG